MEPYELKVYLAISDPNDQDGSTNHTHMIICEPRTWASISLFQVSRQFRSLAIKDYGEPCEDSLPFSPAIDKLVIIGVDNFYWASRLKPIALMAKRIDVRLLRRLHLESVMPYGFLCYYNKSLPTNPDAHLRLVGKKLLERVQHLEIRYMNSSKIGWFHMDWWVYPLRDLTASLPYIKHLVVSFYYYDPYRGIPPLRYMYTTEVLLLNGVIKYTNKADLGHPLLFPHLESFEIVKKPRRREPLKEMDNSIATEVG
ncbi:hypothetical protein F4815DRAFT_501566 [Daldinia loculata]|nr:hypothetical protein F4815DRAFT_501566 [Daldinia loculata]